MIRIFYILAQYLVFSDLRPRQFEYVDVYDLFVPLFFEFPPRLSDLFFFFFNDPATTEFYPLPLPAALPICTSTKPRTTPMLPPKLDPHQRSLPESRVRSAYSTRTASRVRMRPAGAPLGRRCTAEYLEPV